MTSTAEPPFDLKETISANRLVGLWRMLTGYRWYYLGAAASLAVSAAAKTTTFLLLRFFVDQVLIQPDARSVSGLARLPVPPLLVIALGFVGLAAIEGSFSFLSGRLASHTAEGIARRLRCYMYDQIQRLTFTYHDHTQTGDLIQRSTSDVDAIRRFFADQAIGIGRIILLFVINFTAIGQLNMKLAFLSIIVVPAVVAVSAFFFRRIGKAYEKFQEQEATLSTVLQENLSGMRVVRAFARQDFERQKFERENWEKFLRGRRLTVMHAFFWPSSDILCSAQMLFGFTMGALLAIGRVISVGTYLAYAGLVVQIIWPMRNLGRLIVQTSTGLVSYKRVIDVISQTREPLLEGRYHPSGSVHGDVNFDNVSFEYESGSQVLRSVSAQVRSGEVVALLGSTGSGKTTLVSLLPRFYEYSGGSLTLDGVELKDYPRAYLRSQIGIVEQEPFLFSRTIRENITYGVGRDVPDIEVEAAARAAAIHDVISSFPEGYNTLVGEKGITLSGGQKQRVAIARTLLKNPRILILDDSTSSVDTETEAEIRAALDRLMVGRTSFIIAHRVQSVMNADQILVLDKGQVVQRGTHAELLAQPGFYRQIYDLQARIEDELQQELAVAVWPQTAPLAFAGNEHPGNGQH